MMFLSLEIYLVFTFIILPIRVPVECDNNGKLNTTITEAEKKKGLRRVGDQMIDVLQVALPDNPGWLGHSAASCGYT